MRLFALATLTPLPLIALAASGGGVWVALALFWLTALTATLDEVVRRETHAAPGAEFPAAHTLSVILALGHFLLLALVVRALAGDALAPVEKAGLLAAAGLFFGQVSNANAHELIHRPTRMLHGLGTAVYVSLLFGHHASAHPLVHHRLVATRADPSSARLGESFYRFARRAWLGSFRMGLAAETARLRQARRAAWRHPYLRYIGGAALMLAASAVLAGPAGLMAHLALAGLAQTQLLMSDYVQHYGLTRATRGDGKSEPVSARHSWNSPHLMSNALMLNAPRHSDHHSHPGRAYPALSVPPDAPMLPRSLPVMACLALSPRHWRRVMDPRAQEWRNRADITKA